MKCEREEVVEIMELLYRSLYYFRNSTQNLQSLHLTNTSSEELSAITNDKILLAGFQMKTSRVSEDGINKNNFQ